MRVTVLKKVLSVVVSASFLLVGLQGCSLSTRNSENGFKPNADAGTSERQSAQVREYKGGLSVKSVIKDSGYKNLTQAINSAPDKVEEYVRDWLIEKGGYERNQTMRFEKDGNISKMSVEAGTGNLFIYIPTVSDKQCKENEFCLGFSSFTDSPQGPVGYNYYTEVAGSIPTKEQTDQVIADERLEDWGDPYKAGLSAEEIAQATGYTSMEKASKGDYKKVTDFITTWMNKHGYSKIRCELHDDYLTVDADFSANGHSGSISIIVWYETERKDYDLRNFSLDYSSKENSYRFYSHRSDRIPTADDAERLMQEKILV
ncbi:hypothetical protein OZX62_02695 [Bifidobacterium sp. ESL0690]|uniref:hypothetical protein n=1 Tax=Bifidobacterium sp. ESL0690 TaxID=2983214 RepID=UPI0023F68A4D|nr:hypothetical protein [Bifidobacterium sp. ESL0690]WEV47210.1 hypothetical protein OZX62_02695 [Bifidobacterium sp. ESL0690]